MPSPTTAWDEMRDSPRQPPPNLPHPVVPYRQPSYSAAQRQYPLSSPPVPSQADNAPGQEEEDDGGWTVDAPTFENAETRQRRRRAMREGGISLPRSMGALALQQKEEEVPVLLDSHREETSTVEPQVKEEAYDPTPIFQKGTDFSHEPEDGHPAVEQANDVDQQAADLAENLGRSGYHIDPSMLGKIKQLLDSTRPNTSTSNPNPTSTNYQDNQHLDPSTHISVGREYTGPVDNRPPHIRHANQDDPNRLAVMNSKWGNSTSTAAPPPPPIRTPFDQEPFNPVIPPPQVMESLVVQAMADVGSSDDGDWAPDSKVRAWVKDVTPATPPSRPTSPTGASSIARPSSTIPIPEPVTLLISDDGESEPDTDIPTPGKEAPDTSPTLLARAAPASPTARIRTQADHSIISTDDSKRRRRTHQSVRKERSGVPWKRDPHPAFSAQFAQRRLLVRFPFPIRKEAVKPTMLDHFSKYGSIRMTWCHEPQGENTEQVLVVFDEAEAVEICLADPTHTTCIIKTGGRVGTNNVNITVALAPYNLTTKNVYIKVTGPRADSRSRSASPPGRTDRARPDRRDEKGKTAWTMQSLPASIDIDAVPSRKKSTGEVIWWARIRSVHRTFEDVARMAYSITGCESRPIRTIDLGRRVSEKDIIPQLCEYFAEIIDIVPPTNKDQGWLVTVGGTADGRNLMDEISKISGITVRWAAPEDGILNDNQDDQAAEESPMSRLEKHLGGDMSREETLRGRTQPHPIRHYIPDVRDDDKPGIANGKSLPNALDFQTCPPALHTELLESNDPVSASASASPAGSPRSAKSTESHGKEDAHDRPALSEIGPRYPHLRRQIVAMYRGRVLREDASEDTPKFYDDAAIFVGRLVKESETDNTLFQRFSRYGEICAIEYNPKRASGTYATARILYNAKAAADRALRFEPGSVSFGSLLKIDRRRVQNNDVQLEERYVDSWGRAYSPSMASQYSPPQSLVEDDVQFVQPPPLNTAATPIGVPLFHPPHQQLQWIPLAPFQHFQPPPASDQGPPVPLGMPFLAGPPPPGASGAPPVPVESAMSANVPNAPPYLMPMLYTMGIVYNPTGSQAPLIPPAVPSSLPTPPFTPCMEQTNGDTSVPMPINPHTHFHTSRPNPDSITSSSQQAPLPPTEVGNGAVDSSPGGRRRSPKIAGTRMQNGVFKVDYDTEDLKRFCQEEGRPEPRHRDIQPGSASAHSTESTPVSNFASMVPPNIATNGASQRLQPVPIPFSPVGIQANLPIGLGLSPAGSAAAPSSSPIWHDPSGQRERLDLDARHIQNRSSSGYSHSVPSEPQQGGEPSWSNSYGDRSENGNGFVSAREMYYRHKG